LFSEAFVKKGWILKNKDIETSHYICLMAHTKLTPQAAYMPMQNKNKNSLMFIRRKTELEIDGNR